MAKERMLKGMSVRPKTKREALSEVFNYRADRSAYITTERHPYQGMPKGLEFQADKLQRERNKKRRHKI